MRKLMILFLTTLAFTGCAKPTVYWYKPGRNQYDFNIDSRDCDLSAQRLALGMSETGSQPDPDTYARVYAQCIAAKGWSTRPPKRPQAAAPEFALEIDGGQITGFKRTISLPPSYRLRNRRESRFGPTVMKQAVWSDGRTFITIIFQQNLTTFFERSSYPVTAPFQLYDTDAGGHNNRRWASFFSKTGADRGADAKSEWIMGLGAYYYQGSHERIIVVVTAPLKPPEQRPEAGFTLSRGQYQAIDAFTQKWRSWLDRELPAHPASIMSRLKGIILEKTH